MRIRIEIEGETSEPGMLEVLGALRRAQVVERGPLRAEEPAAAKDAVAAIDSKRGAAAPAPAPAPAAAAPAAKRAARNSRAPAGAEVAKVAPPAVPEAPEAPVESTEEPSELESSEEPAGEEELEEAGAAEPRVSLLEVNEAARRVGARSPALVLRVLQSCGVSRVDALPPAKYSLFLRLLQEV